MRMILVQKNAGDQISFTIAFIKRLLLLYRFVAFSFKVTGLMPPEFENIQVRCDMCCAEYLQSSATKNDCGPWLFALVKPIMLLSLFRRRIDVDFPSL